MKRTDKKLALKLKNTKTLDADTLRKVSGGEKQTGFCLSSS